MPRDFYKKANFSKLASERAKTIKHRNEIWRKMLRERCFTAMAEKETIPIKLSRDRMAGDVSGAAK